MKLYFSDLHNWNRDRDGFIFVTKADGQTFRLTESEWERLVSDGSVFI